MQSLKVLANLGAAGMVALLCFVSSHLQQEFKKSRSTSTQNNTVVTKNAFYPLNAASNSIR
jgi:hypothetical protein